MTAFPKTIEDAAAARGEAERIAGDVYLSVPNLALLWELDRREAGKTLTPEDVRRDAIIKHHLRTDIDRLRAIERLCELGLVSFQRTSAQLTPWGRFVASVRRAERG